MECFRLLLEHLAWIKHQFLIGIKDSGKARSLWGMMRGVGGVWKSEHQSWVPTGQAVNKEYYKGVQEVAFPPGQCTSRMECFKLHLSRIEHQFLSGIRDSRKAGTLWGMMRCVWGVRKSIHHSWLPKGLGLGLLCRGFKGVQEEILREEASTLQIGSVAFPPGQCTSPQFYPCHRLFDQDGHQGSSSPSL